MKKKRDSGETGDEEDMRLWQQVARSVKAYPRRDGVSPAGPRKPKPGPRRKAAPAAAPPPPSAWPAASPPAAGFDRSTEIKLKRGKLPLEGRLDLHGMTQAEAFEALRRFVLSSVKQGKRTVLVITGKGKVSEGGVLRRMLPLWLEEAALAPHIIAFTPAHARDGGGGAFYLRLRKAVR